MVIDGMTDVNERSQVEKRLQGGDMEKVMLVQAGLKQV